MPKIQGLPHPTEPPGGQKLLFCVPRPCVSASGAEGHLFCWMPGGKFPLLHSLKAPSLSQATRRSGNQPCVFERSLGHWVPVSVTQLGHVVGIPAETLEPDPTDRRLENRIYGRDRIGGGGRGCWGWGCCVRAQKRRPQLGVTGRRRACPLPCDLSLPPLLFHGLCMRKQHPSEGQRPSLPALGSRCPFRGRLPRVRAPPLGARTPGRPPIPRPLPRAAEQRPRWVRRLPASGAASAPRELPRGPASRKGRGRAGQRPLRGVRAPSAGHGAEVGLVARQGPAGLLPADWGVSITNIERTFKERAAAARQAPGRAAVWG